MVKEKGEVGDVYVASTGQTIYADEEMTPERVEKIRENVYGKGVSRKVQILIFPEEYTITAEDPDGNEDEELSTIMTNMCQKSRLWANMQIAYDDCIWHGPSIFNDVWGSLEEKKNVIVLKKLRHLPAESFNTVPKGITETFARRLAGIVLNSAGEVEYWQTDSKGDTIQITNALCIMEPTSRFIDGDPLMLPIIPIVEMLKYTWNSQMQQVNRVGAKILFIKVTNPRPASISNGGVGDIEYANLILKNWGKDTAYQLRENMELIDLNIKDDSNNLEVIDALYNVVLDYISPSALIARRGDSGLAGGEKEREKLLAQTVSSIHSWLEEQFEQLLNRFFVYNQFPEGWKAYINIPSPRTEITDANIKKVELCLTKEIIPPSRALTMLDIEQLTEEELAELEEWKASKPKPEPNNGGFGDDGFDEEPDETPDETEFTGKSITARNKIVQKTRKEIENEYDVLEQGIMTYLSKLPDMEPE